LIDLHQLSVALVVRLGDNKHKTIRENPNKALIVYPVNNKKAGKKSAERNSSAFVPIQSLYIHTVDRI
jgi:hypothetical protein